MDRLEQLLGRIDRRIIYLGLVIFTLVTLIRQWDLPAPVSQPARSFYETIEKVPKGQVVMIGIDWDAGTQPESRPQMLALARHLVRRGTKCAMISVGYPPSPQLSQDVFEQAIEDEKRLNPAVDYQYGRDWVNMGYKELTRPWLLAFVQEPLSQVKADWKNRPLSDTLMREANRF